MEFAVDEAGNLLEMRAFNQDGEQLVEKLHSGGRYPGGSANPGIVSWKRNI